MTLEKVGVKVFSFNLACFFSLIFFSPSCNYLLIQKSSETAFFKNITICQKEEKKIRKSPSCLSHNLLYAPMWSCPVFRSFFLTKYRMVNITQGICGHVPNSSLHPWVINFASQVLGTVLKQQCRRQPESSHCASLPPRNGTTFSVLLKPTIDSHPFLVHLMRNLPLKIHFCLYSFEETCDECWNILVLRNLLLLFSGEITDKQKEGQEGSNLAFWWCLSGITEWDCCPLLHNAIPAFILHT